MSRKLISVLAFGVVSALAGSAMAQTHITNVISTLSASPAEFRGKCPAVITFTGEIKVEGRFAPTAPVQMGYTFLRSDGATGPIKYYDITGPGTMTVTETWTLGGAALPNYSGWEQLKAWPTAHLGFGYSFSPKAKFVVHCLK